MSSGFESTGTRSFPKGGRMPGFVWWSAGVQTHPWGCLDRHDACSTRARQAYVSCVVRKASINDRILDTDLVTMFDEAFKKQPSNEDLGIQTFFANVRTSNWKSAHQVCQSVKVNITFWVGCLKIATRMYKQFQEDRYLSWSIISAVLQVCFPLIYVYLLNGLLGERHHHTRINASHPLKAGPQIDYVVSNPKFHTSRTFPSSSVHSSWFRGMGRSK